MARRLIARLKAVYNFCLIDAPSLAEKYGLTINPAATVGRRRAGSEGRYGKSQPKTRVLSDAEICAFWQAVSKSGMRKSTQLALKLVLVTAQRTGELRVARKSELFLDLAQPVWIIPVEHTKNRKASHVVPLSITARVLFKEALVIDPSSELLFPGLVGTNVPFGKTVFPTSMANLLRKYLSDMKSASPHDLRRTASTGMRSLGVSRDVVSLILNHAPLGVTAKHYDHHDAMRERGEALEKRGRSSRETC